MSGLNEHITGLAAYNDDEANSPMPPEESPQSDNLIEDPLEVSSEVLIPDPPDEGVDPDVGHVDHEGVSTDTGAEAPPDYKALYEATKVESAGRLTEVTGLRQDRSEANQTLKNLQEMMVEQQRKQAEMEIRAEVEAEMAEEEALYGKDVVNDPGVAYLREKISQNADDIESYRQSQEHRAQSVNDQAQQYQQVQEEVRQIQDAVKRSEEEFSQAQPDYMQAFDFATNKRTQSYVNRGYDQETAEKMVVQEVQFLAKEQTSLGRSPAKAAYDIAVEWGWNQNMMKQQPGKTPLPAQAHPGVQDYNAMLPNVDKLKAGVTHGRGTGEFAGSSGNTRPNTLTREQFFATVPANTRMQVLADPDKFEELGKTGHIVIDW